MGIKDVKVFNSALLGNYCGDSSQKFKLYGGAIVDKHGVIKGSWRTRDITSPSGL